MKTSGDGTVNSLDSGRFTTRKRGSGETHMQDTDRMKVCVELCWSCRTECQQTLVYHCLEMGGEHLEKEHVKLMLDCIEICQTAADFMDRQSELHAVVCKACAIVCEACAESCEAIEDEKMKQCAEACRKCSESCNEMSQMQKAA